ncbi:hypothetical protein CK203_055237 [Vitis vinifera]|uniref:Uncharacterized protein n=1 Tax=Vitis vinifera TaxID=29760 RepID=A0A438CCJ7_VITVI|nr:hypothetical protein CK203_112303 [Vitis vinifera]RVW75677.1 hypothetical protein CK203_055237 [Vitis vinifera]
MKVILIIYNCRDHPKHTHGSLTKHSSFGHVACPTLSRCAQGLTRGTSNLPSGRPWGTCYAHFPCPDVLAGIRARILNRSDLPQPALPAYRAKRLDDGKSSLPQSLTAACRIMMALPPSKHHHDKLKSLPTIKKDKAPGTIKRPHTIKEGKRKETSSSIEETRASGSYSGPSNASPQHWPCLWEPKHWQRCPHL